jgi:hypothetical protein
MTAEMSQWDLTGIKSTKAIRPYEFKATLITLLEDRPPLGGRGGIFGAPFVIAEPAPLFHATSAARLTARPDLSERATSQIAAVAFDPRHCHPAASGHLITRC